jgi:hypothetical protein
MIKTNHYLIKGGNLSGMHKASIVGQLLSARSKPEQAKRFNVAVTFPNNMDASGRRMYPAYYIPPYNDGKKLKTIFNQTPKTHILSANMYELEILRLLFLLAPENDDIKVMISETLKRLKTTCFGYQDDGLGECFDASLVVLRFISAVTPNDTDWITSRIQNYNKHVSEKRRPWYVSWYYWLCLSEMPFETAEHEIDKYKDIMLNWLYNKSCVMNSEHDKVIHPVIISMLRNIIAKYPDYEYIKDREPYISEKDGRLHFDMCL